MKQARWSLPLCTAGMSGSVMILEIGLTRFFSVMFEYHYSFLVISLSVLGLGLGGLAAFTAAGPRAGKGGMEDAVLRLRTSSLGAGLAVLAMLFSLLLFSPLRTLIFAVPAALIPFFFAGVFLSSVFRRQPGRSALLYAADLAGAAVGAIASVPLLQSGAVNVVLLVGMLMLLPSAFLAPSGYWSAHRIIGRFGPFAVAFALVVLNTTTGFLGDVPFSRTAFKEMANMMTGPTGRSKIMATRWSSFGRTDVVRGGNRSDELALFIDGTAGTVMYRFDGDLRSLPLHELTAFPGYFPLQMMPPEEKRRMLVIGPGGGRDVLTGLIGGVEEITAVEVNRDLVDLMKRYAVYNGGLYSGYPGVRVVTEEGRRFVQSDSGEYEVIMLSIPVTKTSRSPEGFALTENYLFTVESFEEYFERLSPRGRLVVVAHDAREIFRLTFTALEVMKRRGMDAEEAMRHIYTVGPEMFPVFVFGREPLTPEESEAIHRAMHGRDYRSRAAFIPYIEQKRTPVSLENGFQGIQAMLNETLYALATGKADPQTLIETANLDVRPATDDRSFFYSFDRELPREVTSLIVLSLIALVPGWLIRGRESKEGRDRQRSAPFLLLFTSIGIGFMLIEIPLMQKFMLFLGQPAYSMAILLASLLIGAAAGSWTVRRLRSRSGRYIGLAVSSVAVLLLTAAALPFLDRLFGAFPGLAIGGRAAVSAVLILPLGFFLGMPFPLGMRLLSEAGLADHLPRMWGVNGIASVAGSALSIGLSMTYGFSAAIGVGAALYLVPLAIALLRMRNPEEKTESFIPGTPVSGTAGT